MHCGCSNNESLVRTGAPSLPGGEPALASSQQRHDCISSVMHDHGYTTREVLDWLIAKCASPPTASAGGSDTQVQFNDGGALAGADGVTWDKTNRKFICGDAAGAANNTKITVDDSTTSVSVDSRTGATTIGDVINVGGGTKLTVSDSALQITATTGGRGILIDGTNSYTTVGDHLGNGNGTLAKVDDANLRIQLAADKPVIGNTTGNGLYVYDSGTSTYWQWQSISGVWTGTDTGSASLP